MERGYMILKTRIRDENLSKKITKNTEVCQDWEWETQRQSQKENEEQAKVGIILTQIKKDRRISRQL